MRIVRYVGDPDHPRDGAFIGIRDGASWQQEDDCPLVSMPCKTRAARAQPTRARGLCRPRHVA